MLLFDTMCINMNILLVHSMPPAGYFMLLSSAFGQSAYYSRSGVRSNTLQLQESFVFDILGDIAIIFITSQMLVIALVVVVIIIIMIIITLLKITIIIAIIITTTIVINIISYFMLLRNQIQVPRQSPRGLRSVFKQQIKTTYII